MLALSTLWQVARRSRERLTTQGRYVLSTRSLEGNYCEPKVCRPESRKPFLLVSFGAARPFAGDLGRHSPSVPYSRTPAINPFPGRIIHITTSREVCLAVRILKELEQIQRFYFEVTLLIRVLTVAVRGWASGSRGTPHAARRVVGDVGSVLHIPTSEGCMAVCKAVYSERLRESLNCYLKWFFKWPRCFNLSD